MTAEDFQPRRDGWFEHQGTWGEVTVGTVVASPSRRSERWEIIDVAHGLQTDHGQTLWMRGREQVSGQEESFHPRMKTSPVLILNQDPADTSIPPVTPASDAEVIAALVEKLGATPIAARDHATGEITCPNYASEVEPGLLEHLRLAHGVDTGDLERLGWEDQIREAHVVHGRSHDRQHAIGKAGFPHRHVPEDLTIYRNNRRTL